MIDKDTLQRLAAGRSPNHQFLSVFVSTSLLDDWRQTLPTFLNSERLRLERERDLTKDELRTLDDHFARLQQLVQYDIPVKTEGVSVFADGSGEFVEQIEWPVRFVNRVVLGPSAYLRPVVRAIDQRKPFLLVRVSRDESSIHVVNDGGLARTEDLAGPYLKSGDRETGDVPVKEYYAAARQYSLVELHYKDVAGAVDRLLAETGIPAVVICGLHDIVSNFRKQLSQPATVKVRADIAWDAVASVNQTVAAARDALLGAQKNEREALAQRIAESLGLGRGVAGYDQTMAAVQRGQVQTLLVDSAYEPPGWLCRDCDFAVLTPAAACPLCGGGLIPVGDAVAEAVRVALLRGTYVVDAGGVPSLANLGGIAGLMRYR